VRPVFLSEPAEMPRNKERDDDYDNDDGVDDAILQ
jgi:hypothetical protein